jgi:hypothetical protein
MVPKKGLEPPHPCGYMDLNHARLPIPPLRRGAAAERRREGYTEKYFTGANRGLQTEHSQLATTTRNSRHCTVRLMIAERVIVPEVAFTVIV